MPVCWHERFSRHLTPCRHHHADGVIVAGRTRSGKRWFWAATDWSDGAETSEHGYADTEADAITAYQAAGDRLAGTRDMSGSSYAGHAADQLKQVNAAKRSTRPAPDASEAAAVEYLYGRNDRYGIVTFRVTKKTAKRVYYVREEHCLEQYRGTVGFVDRQTLERDGEVYRRSAGWWKDDFHLFATRERAQGLPTEQSEPVDLRALRRAAAEAHPDRGGTAEGFRDAHARYLAAKRQHAAA